jgi:hypothetical protein
MTVHTNESAEAGDIIQTGLILANGDGSIDWGSHQVVRRVSSDGTLWYRPRDAKVDKCPDHWRFPVEPCEKIIKDLKHFANPAEGKKAIKEIGIAISKKLSKKRLKDFD